MLQNRLKFTDRTINALNKEGYYWDISFPKLGLYVGKRNKTFITLQDRNRKTLGHYPALSLAEARNRLKAILYGPTAENAPQAKTRASDAISEYLSGLQIRSRTLKDYARLLHRHFLPNLGTCQLSAVTAGDILKITDALRHTPSEARHAHAAMQTFFNWCVPRHLKLSPMHGLRSPSKPGKRSRILSDAELKAVWHATSGYDLDHIVKICIATGMRRSEAAALQLSWIQGDLLIVPPHISKNHDEIVLPITPFLSPLLELAPFKRFNWSRAKHAHDASSKVRNYILHDLRRSMRSKLSEWKCCDSDTAERLIGHKVGSEVQQIYDRWDYLPEKRQAIERYSERLRQMIELPIA